MKPTNEEAVAFIAAMIVMIAAAVIMVVVTLRDSKHWRRTMADSQKEWFIRGPLNNSYVTLTLSYPIYQYVCTVIEHRYDADKPDKNLAQATGGQINKNFLIHTLPPETIAKDILTGEALRNKSEAQKRKGRNYETD